MKAYRITLDYNEFSFEDLRMEYYKDKKATWYIKSANPKIKSDFDIFGKDAMDAYIYCSNMPDGLNRFVFKGKIHNVTINQCLTKTDKKYKDYKSKIILSNIKVFDEKDASKLAIRNGNGISFTPQGTYGELNDSVLKILEIIEANLDLTVFLDRFTGCNCELEGFKNSELCHSSFKKENNEKYVEFHHLIFRNFGYNDSELLKKLDSSSCNYARLCPACHRAIHYGNSQLKKEMIERLIKNKNNELEQLYNECLKIKSFKECVNNYDSKDFKDFIYKIYGIRAR